MLKANGVAFTEHLYEWIEHGGAQHSADVLGWDPFAVVKTLVMEDERQIGEKSVEPCKPEVANRHSGYLVGIAPQACVKLLDAKPVNCALAE